MPAFDRYGTYVFQFIEFSTVCVTIPETKRIDWK